MPLSNGGRRYSAVRSLTRAYDMIVFEFERWLFELSRAYRYLKSIMWEWIFHLLGVTALVVCNAYLFRTIWYLWAVISSFLSWQLDFELGGVLTYRLWFDCWAYTSENTEKIAAGRCACNVWALYFCCDEKEDGRTERSVGVRWCASNALKFSPSTGEMTKCSCVSQGSVLWMYVFFVYTWLLLCCCHLNCV